MIVSGKLYTPDMLRTARAYLGWSRKEAALAIGISYITVENVETERTRPHNSTILKFVDEYESQGVVFEYRNGLEFVGWRSELQDG